MHRWGNALLITLVAGLATGCATGTTAKGGGGRVPEDGPTRHRLKLAVLPVESDQYPRLAKGVNGVFHDIQVPGVDDYFLSRVTLEVAQLAIECVDVTNTCWSAVGKSLTSDRLLMAQIGRGSPKNRKDRSISLTVTYFDVSAAQPLQTVNKAFKNEDDALRGMKDLIDSVIAPGGSAATASAGGAR
jgi:hypothetical protein